jgi:hypothetical protein
MDLVRSERADVAASNEAAGATAQQQEIWTR